MNLAEFHGDLEGLADLGEVAVDGGVLDVELAPVGTLLSADFRGHTMSEKRADVRLHDTLAVLASGIVPNENQKVVEGIAANRLERTSKWGNRFCLSKIFDEAI